MRRVVARAHGVDVVPLHQLDVAAHRRRGRACARASGWNSWRLTPRKSTGRPLTSSPPSTADPCGSRSEVDPLARGRDRRRVQPGRLGGPGLDARDADGLAGGEVDARARAPSRAPGASRDQRPPQRPVVESAWTKTSSIAPAGRASSVTSRKMPGQPPHVLVLEVGARRPLVHAHGEDVVLAGRRRAPASNSPAAGCPYEVPSSAVEPRPQAGVHALEAQDRVHARPVRRQVEDPPVVAGRVLVRDERRVDGERVADVRVGGRPEPCSCQWPGTSMASQSAASKPGAAKSSAASARS